MNIAAPKITLEALDAIKDYKWPGNIRQLENSMVYAASMARGGKIYVSDLPEEAMSYYNLSDMVKNETIPLRDIEKAAIYNAMAKTNNDTSAVSDLLGISKTTLYRRLKEYGFNTHYDPSSLEE